jgi:hypothetical protein
MVADALLKGEEVELVRTGIERAKAGDTVMLKFFLERILPKERSVRIDIPALNSVMDAIEALARVAGAVSTGQITANEAAGVASAITAYARMTDLAEAEQRVDNIENQLRALKQ